MKPLVLFIILAGAPQAAAPQDYAAAQGTAADPAEGPGGWSPGHSIGVGVCTRPSSVLTIGTSGPRR